MINWRGKRGSTFGQNVLYAYMEFSINFLSLPKKNPETTQASNHRINEEIIVFH